MNRNTKPMDVQPNTEDIHMMTRAQIRAIGPQLEDLASEGHDRCVELIARGIAWEITGDMKVGVFKIVMSEIEKYVSR